MTARYIAPVSSSRHPRRSASSLATVLLPAPAGPSIVTTLRIVSSAHSLWVRRRVLMGRVYRGPRRFATVARTGDEDPAARKSGSFRVFLDNRKTLWNKGQRRATLRVGGKRPRTGLTTGRGNRKVATGLGTQRKSDTRRPPAPGFLPFRNRASSPFSGATIGSFGTRLNCLKKNEPTHPRIKDRCVGSVLMTPGRRDQPAEGFLALGPSRSGHTACERLVMDGDRSRAAPAPRRPRRARPGCTATEASPIVEIGDAFCFYYPLD